MSSATNPGGNPIGYLNSISSVAGNEEVAKKYFVAHLRHMPSCRWRSGEPTQRARTSQTVFRISERSEDMAVDQTYIKNLAEANGLTIPEERLEAVLQQYQSFLRTIERMDAVLIEREIEPAIDFSLESLDPATGPAGERR